MPAVLQDLPCTAAASAPLDALVSAVSAAMTLARADIPQAVRRVLVRHADTVFPLSPSQWAGDRERYTRHLLHADPAGRFSVMALVWHPGQRTPAHGHRTWCAYLVLRGELRESRYAWQAARDCATQTDTVDLRSGQTLCAPAGLAAIHSLGNESHEVAVSIHVYGVNGEQIATHVNHVVRGEPC